MFEASRMRGKFSRRLRFCGARRNPKGGVEGSHFLWLLSFGDAKESNPPSGGTRRSLTQSIAGFAAGVD
jgi:hypothetical protein